MRYDHMIKYFSVGLMMWLKLKKLQKVFKILTKFLFL